MTLARSVTHSKTLVNPSSGSGDLVYGSDYVSPTSHSAVVAGATSGGIPYFDSATSEASSALLAQYGVVVGGGAGAAPATYSSLTYTETSGPRLQIGSGSGTSTGMTLGYFGASGNGSIWSTATASPDTSNYNIVVSAADTTINAPTTDLNLRTGTSIKLKLTNTAGFGPIITAGTAITDVAALSVTRTNNNAAVATGVRFTFTDTTSAAGFLPLQILGSSSGAANLFKVDKTGSLTAGADVISNNATYLIRTGTTLTDVAGSGGGTLTNAPTAGNPTKWIGIDDNGTLRKIPTWT